MPRLSKGTWIVIIILIVLGAWWFFTRRGTASGTSLDRGGTTIAGGDSPDLTEAFKSRRVYI